jgi:hypothetical protein
VSQNTPPPDSGNDLHARILELVGEHARQVLADTDQIVQLAEARAQQIPKEPDLARQVRAHGALIGELLVLLRALELDVADLRKRGRRR